MQACLQDDEALFLYSIVYGMRMSSVLEIGGLRGYSAQNFLQAMKPTQGELAWMGLVALFSCDSSPLRQQPLHMSSIALLKMGKCNHWPCALRQPDFCAYLPCPGLQASCTQ